MTTVFFWTLSFMLSPLNISPSAICTSLSTLFPYDYIHTQNSWLTFLPSHLKGISHLGSSHWLELRNRRWYHTIFKSFPQPCRFWWARSICWVDLVHMNTESTEASMRNPSECLRYNPVFPWLFFFFFECENNARTLSPEKLSHCLLFFLNYHVWQETKDKLTAQC